ncbi:hypothetical protein [Roseimaritima sediminicola]|uniref:hypothetical protein n=1 Tax=Roseimaritima sediminicola TaxID=2662066 RepID=UPI0012984FE6|nr:hypothetical protein [Roseimaritima sediminicola]
MSTPSDGFGPNPDGFGPNPNVPPPDSGGSSSAVKWVLGILGGLAVVMLLCCGGCFLLAKFGLDQVGNQVASQVRNDPVVVEHIGQVESVEMDFMETSRYQQETGDSDAVVFTITGDKGTGVLKGSQVGPNQMGDFILETGGESYPLEQSTSETPTIEVGEPQPPAADPQASEPVTPEP